MENYDVTHEPKGSERVRPEYTQHIHNKLLL